MLTVRNLRLRPSPLRVWWIETRWTIAGVCLWGAAMCWFSWTPLDAEGPSRLYRIQMVEGALFAERANTERECNDLDSDALSCMWTDPSGREGWIRLAR